MDLFDGIVDIMTVYLLSFVNIIVSYATLIIMFQFNDVNNSINTNY